jgi:hypothetical protein
MQPILLLLLLLLPFCRYDEVRFYTNYAAPNMNDFGKWGHFTQVCRCKLCSSTTRPMHNLLLNT